MSAHLEVGRTSLNFELSRLARSIGQFAFMGQRKEK